MPSKAYQLSAGETASVPWWTSCRFTLALVACFGSVCQYLLRANMSVGIVCMTRNNTDTTSPNVSLTSAIPAADRHWVEYQHLFNMQDPFAENSKQGEFDWSRELQGWVLSSFYVGYILTQVAGGWLANKFGAKVILGTAIALFTALTLLTPVVARASIYLLMVLQALKGFVSGVFYPVFFQLFGRWTTPDDRTFIVTIFLTGSAIGTVISNIISGYLCDYGFDGGWPSIFYISGMVGALFCVVWYFLGYSSPKEHPRISPEELEYIESSKTFNSDVKTLAVPWKDLLTTVPLYSIMVTDFCHMWCWFVALSCLPQYMDDVLGFDMSQNGLYSALPYITNIILAILGSIMADFILSRKILSRTKTRKLCQTLAMLPGAALSVGVAFISGDQVPLAVALLALWVGFMGFSRSGSAPTMIDMAPKYSGVINGINQTTSTIPGIIAPIIVGIMTKNKTVEEWQTVFFLNAGIAVFGWLAFVLFVSAEEQKWAKTDPERSIIEVPGHKPHTNLAFEDSEKPKINMEMISATPEKFINQH